MKGCMQPVAFGQFFRYFHSYWNICQKREMLHPLRFFLYTKTIFEYLDNEWRKNE